jgi:hypothetical protein
MLELIAGALVVPAVQTMNLANHAENTSNLTKHPLDIFLHLASVIVHGS